jgi:hypothetical protein
MTVTLETDFLPTEPFGEDVGIVARSTGRRYVLVIERNTIDDMVKGGNFRTFAERSAMVRERLAVIQGIADRLLGGGDVPPGRVVIPREAFPHGSLGAVRW